MTSEAFDASACSVAIRTSFLPSSSASSLFGPPIRVDLPAARMIAATLRLPSISGFSRGCGRVTISINRPPTPIPISSARVTFNPARSRISTQSKPFSPGECAQHRDSTGAADQEEIAGIDRHAEMLDGAANARYRSRDHVAAIGNGGSAEHDDEFRAKREQLVDGGRQRLLLVRHAALGDDGG